MQGPRILVVSSDVPLAASIADALSSISDHVIQHHTFDAALSEGLRADLLLVHFKGASPAAALAVLQRVPEGSVIALLPSANLITLVDLLQNSTRVAGMVATDELELDYLVTLAARLTGRELFGLARVMRPGADIRSLEVHDYAERATAIATITAHATGLGANKRQQTLIEQCVDEMLMNALYDAPVDEADTPLFAGITVRQRIRLRIEQTVTVEYGHDGKRFALAVRDAYGSLDRASILRVLHKCLHARDKIDRKAGGAGVGLYLMVNASTEIYFHVLPRIATEAICAFDLQAAAPRLEQFGYLVQATDPTGALHSARRPPGATPLQVAPSSADRQRRLALAAGALAVVGGVAAVALSRSAESVAPAARDASVQAPVTALTLDSEPTGARVIINRAVRGETPVTVTDLMPATKVSVTFERDGYAPATVQLEVPVYGEHRDHRQVLVATGELVTVRVTSEPSGARVIRLGTDAAVPATRTFTPAELLVDAGREQRLLLTMPGFVPVMVPPFTPVHGAAVERNVALTPGLTLHIVGPVDSVISVLDASHCQRLTLPAECVLVPGKHVVEFTSHGQTVVRQAVMLTDDSATVTVY